MMLDDAQLDRAAGVVVGQACGLGRRTAKAGVLNAL
jgi:hypothetical protein